MTIPWMVIGDFIVVLGAHEKSGGSSPSSLSCTDFQSMTYTCDFVHLDTPGLYFTWSNGWSIGGHIERCLDRSLCDTNWFETWPYTSCMALPRVVSDHCPLIFSALKLSQGGRKPFRFQSMWLQHPNFLSYFHSLLEICSFVWLPNVCYSAKIEGSEMMLAYLDKGGIW